jgi:predicted HTH domain antitoxin
MPTITFDLPQRTVNAMGRSAAELARDVQLAAAMYWFSRGEISQEEAAALAGLDRTDFILVCGRTGVNVFQTDHADLIPDPARRETEGNG